MCAITGRVAPEALWPSNRPWDEIRRLFNLGRDRIKLNETTGEFLRSAPDCSFTAKECIAFDAAVTSSLARREALTVASALLTERIADAVNFVQDFSSMGPTPSAVALRAVLAAADFYCGYASDKSRESRSG